MTRIHTEMFQADEHKIIESSQHRHRNIHPTKALVFNEYHRSTRIPHPCKFFTQRSIPVL